MPMRTAQLAPVTGEPSGASTTRPTPVSPRWARGAQKSDLLAANDLHSLRPLFQGKKHIGRDSPTDIGFEESEDFLRRQARDDSSFEALPAQAIALHSIRVDPVREEAHQPGRFLGGFREQEDLEIRVDDDARVL